MDWNLDGLAQIAAEACGLKWDEMTQEERDAMRAVAAAVLDAVLAALAA